MSFEIEKNYYDVDLAQLRNKLKLIDAKHKGTYLFKIYSSTHNGKYIRLRDEVTKKTFTIKDDSKGKYEVEYEINVDDIEMTKKMLELLGINFFMNGEKVREIYNYKNSEIAIDYVFGLINFVQIESATEKELLQIAKELDIEGKENYIDVYEIYGIDKEKVKKMNGTNFKNIKDVKKLVTKNKIKYNELIKIQKDIYNKASK